MSVLVLGIVLVVLAVGIQYVDEGVILKPDLNNYALFVGSIASACIIWGVVLVFFAAGAASVAGVAARK